MLKKIVKTALCLSSAMLITATWANSNTQTETKANIEVNLAQNVTDQELAAIYVLSEICPTLLQTEETEKFQSGYQRFSQEYLENQDAVAYLKHISQQSNFQPALTEAKADAQTAGQGKNSEICRELVSYSSYSQ